MSTTRGKPPESARRRLVRFPYSNFERVKARPALVISQDDYNGQNEDVIVCAVTSNPRSDPFRGPITSDDFTEGELPVDSMVRADKLLQVEKELIDYSLDRLDSGAVDQVSSCICELVGRPEP